MTKVRTNIRVAGELRELARAKQLQGSPWSATAYRNAATAVENHDVDVGTLGAPALRKIEGIGKTIAEAIITLASGRETEDLTRARDDVPASVFSMTRIPGVGEVRATKLYRRLGYLSFEEILEAAHSGDLDAEPRLRQAVLAADRLSGRIPWRVAHRTVRSVRERLRNATGASRIILRPAGSYRRRKPTVGDIDFLFATKYDRRRAKVIAAFHELGQTIQRGAYKNSVYLDIKGHGLVRTDLLCVDPGEMGAALLFFTGSDAHCRALRAHAKNQGLLLNESGLWRGKRCLSYGMDERGIYRLLGVTPEAPPRRTGKLRRRSR